MDYPYDRYEVIVVDDGSPEPVATHLRNADSRLNLRCMHQQQKGPAQARNLGLSHASGTLIAFTDDDCRPTAQWLSTFAAAHVESPEAALAGPVHNAVHSKVASEASQLLVDYCVNYFDLPNTGRGFFPSNNMAFPIKQLRSLGGFSSDFPLTAAEDRDLCARWSEIGHRFLFLPEAVVEHYHDLDLRRFTRQQLTYGRGAWFHHHAQMMRTGNNVPVEPLGFYSGMFASALRSQPFPRSLQVCSLLLLSQALTAAGFYLEKTNSKLS